MRTWLIGPVVSAALAACSTGLDNLKTAAEIDHQARGQLSGAAVPHAAIASWDRAIATLQPDGDDYLDEELYIDRARYASNQALTELLWDRPEQARERYIATLSTLRDDVERHKQEAQETNEAIQSAGMVLGVASALLGGYAAGSAATPYQQQAMLQQTQLISTNLMMLGNLDWAGLEDIKEQAPEQLDVDVVRMPFFAHFHELAAIGRLRTDSSWCTASLVGERLALTNAHCVYDGQRLRGPAEVRLEFDKLGSRRRSDPSEGVHFAGGTVGVRQIHVSPDYGPSPDETSSLLECGQDWAILELASHPSGIGYLEVAEDLDFRATPVPAVYRGGELVGDRLVVAGYSGDLNQGQLITMDYGCPIEFSGPWVGYRCATYGGASGSPILLANGPYRLTHVVGVNACGSAAKQADSWRNYVSRDDVQGASGTSAERFVDLLLDLRQATGSTYNPSDLGATIPGSSSHLSTPGSQS